MVFGTLIRDQRNKVKVDLLCSLFLLSDSTGAALHE